MNLSKLQSEAVKETYIGKNPFQASRDVDFFLRIHRHLPDNYCGGSPLRECKYRPDGIPINIDNDYVEELRKNPEFVKKEKEIEEKLLSIQSKGK